MRIFARPRRKWMTVFLLLLVGFVGVVSRVEASDGMRGDRCEVAEDEYIAEDFYFFCRILEVRGTVDGDLIGVASEIKIERTAVVTGDLWVGGGKLTLSGTIGDDVHFAGINLSVSDEARFTHDRIDVLSVALNTEITREAAIPGDLLVYGYQARVDGTVGGDVDFGGKALTIRGVVQGRIDASVGDSRRSADIPGLPIYDVSFSNPGLRIGDQAYIGGDLAYESASRSHIPAGVVQGRTRYKQSLSQPDITKVEQADAAAEILADYIVASLRDVLTLMIIGVSGLLVAPNFIRQPAQHVRRRTVPTVGWGLLTFMLSFPVAIVLIVISLLILLILIIIKLNTLSIMTGVGLLVINLALVGGFGFLLLFMGRVIVSFAIGQLIYRYVLRSTEPGALRKWITTLAIGAAVYALITNAPVPALGLTVELVTALAGIGAVVVYARQVMYTSDLFAPRLPISEPIKAAAVTRTAPLPEDSEIPPGMDNLPEGFSGFDEDW